MNVARRAFPACDGLRAVAAASVFVFHASVLTGLAARNQAGPYFSQLDVGIDVFFVLSGFLLYRPFAVAHVTGRPAPALGHYLKRRFLRIFPAYWLVLICVLYVFHQATAPRASDGLAFFSLTQIYSKERVLGGLVPAWTLCTEIAFYVFLPAYAWAAGRWARKEPRLRVELLAVLVLYTASCVFRIAISTSGYHLAETWLPSYLDVFALGILLAVVSAAVENGVAGTWWRSVPRDSPLSRRRSTWPTISLPASSASCSCARRSSTRTPAAGFARSCRRDRCVPWDSSLTASTCGSCRGSSRSRTGPGDTFSSAVSGPCSFWPER